MIKDRRLQVRVTTQELDGINRRAHAAGMSVAEYARQLLLAGDDSALHAQETLGFEDPSLSREEILEDEAPEDVAERRRIMAEAGFPASDWVPKIQGREESGAPPAQDAGLAQSPVRGVPEQNDEFMDDLVEHMTKAIENPGVASAIVEGLTISVEEYERLKKECKVTDLPPGVRCIICGETHGS